MYIDRSEINLALGDAGQAEEDAQRAVAALDLHRRQGEFSSKLGIAFLAQARALVTEDKKTQARAVGMKAFDLLQGSFGPYHPDTQAARQFTD